MSNFRVFQVLTIFEILFPGLLFPVLNNSNAHILCAWSCDALLAPRPTWFLAPQYRYHPAQSGIASRRQNWFCCTIVIILAEIMTTCLKEISTTGASPIYLSYLRIKENLMASIKM